MNLQKLAKRTAIVAIPVLTFIFGVSIAEGQTVTETVTETETVEVSNTPQACLDALDYSDELSGYFGEALDSAASSIGYAMALDAASLDAETAKLEELTPQVEQARSSYDLAATECRVAQS